jgi:dihydrofolate reductase
MPAEMAGIPLALVVAAAENGVIGRDNGLIWRLKTDLRRFRALTMGRPLVLGRKTWESIGRPLPGREIVVVTRDPAYAAEGVRVVRGLDEAVDLGRRIAAASGVDSVAVGGGGEIFRALAPQAQRVYLTIVHDRPEGDVTFDPVDPSVFREVAREEHPAGPDDEHAFTFVDYIRR